jgi:YgiT-type zinc finger domain-containing protein
MNECPICGGVDLKIRTRDEMFYYMGFDIILSKYVLLQCNKCRAMFPDKHSKKKSKPRLSNHREMVDSIIESNELLD